MRKNDGFFKVKVKDFLYKQAINAMYNPMPEVPFLEGANEVIEWIIYFYS